MSLRKFWIAGIFALSLLVASGCVKNQAGRHEEMLRGYIGSPVQSLVETMGVPTAYFRNENGTIYEWLQRGQAWNPWLGSYRGNCATRVTTDPDDIILSFTLKGNACGQL